MNVKEIFALCDDPWAQGVIDALYAMGGDSALEIMVRYITGCDELPEKEELEDALLSDLEGIVQEIKNA